MSSGGLSVSPCTRYRVPLYRIGRFLLCTSPFLQRRVVGHWSLRWKLTGDPHHGKIFTRYEEGVGNALNEYKTFEEKGNCVEPLNLTEGSLTCRKGTRDNSRRTFSGTTHRRDRERTGNGQRTVCSLTVIRNRWCSRDSSTGACTRVRRDVFQATYGRIFGLSRPGVYTCKN